MSMMVVVDRSINETKTEHADNGNTGLKGYFNNGTNDMNAMNLLFL